MAERTAMPGLVEVMKALACEQRVKILQLLKGHPLCVNAITCRLGITQSAVSQHLRVLRKAGLIVPDRRGYWTHYSVDSNAMAKCAGAVGRLFSVESKGT